jgi:hypothetical protein
LVGLRAFDGVTLGVDVSNSVLPRFEASGPGGFEGSHFTYDTSLLTFLGAFSEVEPFTDAASSLHFTGAIGGLVLSQGRGNNSLDTALTAKGWGGSVGARYEFATTGRVSWGTGIHVTVGHVYNGSAHSFVVSDDNVTRSEWLISPALELSATYR